jgi:choline dehydrogenase-like flavoprotein
MLIVVVFASKEVILSAGALDSPKLLLLSGIGPSRDMDQLGISAVHDLPGVGQNLQDHCHFPINAFVKEGSKLPNHLRPGSAALTEARERFAKDGSGPLSYVNSAYVMGFLKEPSIYESAAFKELDAQTQAHLKKATVPSWELGTGMPGVRPQQGPPKQLMNAIGVLMNPQSRGVVRLQSADAREPALFDPKYMSHPYDQKVLVTAGKAILAFFQSPSIAATIEAPANMPASDSDEDVLAFVKANVGSTWHMSGTCKMGTEADELAVVDSRFGVKGVEGLRVVDLSVLPFLVNAHPVASAYLVGEMGAAVVGKQYGR